MRSGRVFSRSGFLASAMATTAMLVAVPQIAIAQEQAGSIEASGRYRFNIPAKSLASAIADVGALSGWRIAYNFTLSADTRSRPLSGTMTPPQAIERLLAGTGISYRVAGAQSIILADPQRGVAGAATAVGSDGSTVLETITVQGQGATTEGTGSYTTSQMATATGLPLSIRETPQSVTVITRQRLEDQGGTSLEEALETASGISVQKFDSDRRDFVARGFSVNEFQYDGVVIQAEGIYDWGLSNADMTIYDRVEIVKGANGLLQGAGSPGAAVNLVRKRPTDTFQGSVTGTAGSWNTYRSEVDLAGPLNPDGTLRGRFSGSFEGGESYLDHYEKKSFTLYGILEADIGDSTTLTLGTDYQKNRPRGSSWTGLPMFYSDGSRTDFDVSTNPATEWSRRDTFTNNTFVALDHEFDNRWKANLTYTHRRNGHDTVLGSAGSGYPDPVTGEGVYQYVGKFSGRLVHDTVDAKVSGPIELFGREHDLMFGATASHKTDKGPRYGYGGVNYDPAVPNFFTWDGKTTEPDFDLVGRYESSLTQYGVYASARLRPSDNLSFILGSRVSWYDFDDKGTYENTSATWSGANQYSAKGKITPYIGVVYDINDTYSVYASYTSIFKPQENQDFGGNYLDPEEGHSYEAGVKAAFLDGRLNAGAAIFMTKQDNLAETAGYDIDLGRNYYTAADGVTTKGFELELSGEIAPDWNVYASYTYARARKADGERVYSFIQTAAPDHVVKLYTTYNLPGDWDRLTVGGGIRWQDEVHGYAWSPSDVYENIVQKNVFLVDLMAKYKVNEKIDVTFNVKNLLNEKYYSGLGNFDTGYYGEPRSFSVSTKFKF